MSMQFTGRSAMRTEASGDTRAIYVDVYVIQASAV